MAAGAISRIIIIKYDETQSGNIIQRRQAAPTINIMIPGILCPENTITDFIAIKLHTIGFDAKNSLPRVKGGVLLKKLGIAQNIYVI